MGRLSFAGVPGLEPRLTEPESVGLPITLYPIGHTAPGLPGRADVVYRIRRRRANQPEPHGQTRQRYSGSATRWSGSNSCKAGGSRATATWDLPLATARPPPNTARRSRFTTCSEWVISSSRLACASAVAPLPLELAVAAVAPLAETRSGPSGLCCHFLCSSGTAVSSIFV